MLVKMRSSSFKLPNTVLAGGGGGAAGAAAGGWPPAAGAGVAGVLNRRDQLALLGEKSLTHGSHHNHAQVLEAA
jgi:hypothetical protein